MRSWLAYKLVGWALWLDHDYTMRMALALSAENARRELELRGLHLVPNEDGIPTLQPINDKPNTLH